ncbi:MAG: glycoside hydrolase family 3 C-terminal domain-containing protein [Clostridia bacterium]|nr:glycoside hydrolase family 3 C-terminal domain-containing protein [Clostridia bacterium]
MKWYPGQKNQEVSPREEMIRRISREAAAEGMVLLENRGVLPLKAGTRLGLFGRGARYTIKGGTGSGDVNSRNTISVWEGLKNAGFEIVNEDYLERYDRLFQKSLKEWETEVYRAAGPNRDAHAFYIAHAATMPALPEIQITAGDTAGADVLIYVISRISGEFADRHAEKGDYALSDRESAELETLGAMGKPVIVLLNVGGIIDLSFQEKIRTDAILLMSQAGSEGGNAVADVLSGKVNPSGKLTDTWARRYEDYPSSATFAHRNGNLIEEAYTEGIYVGYRYFDSFGVRPRYPFGYGLSYTRFTSAPVRAALEGTTVTVQVQVRNTGDISGKQVIQAYAACPDGALQTEAKRLVAFGKTKLLQPGEAEELALRFELDALTVWHEGHAAWMLQAGIYCILTGEDAEHVCPAVQLQLTETIETEKLSNICELQEALKEIRPEKPAQAWKEFPAGTLDITDAAKALAAGRNQSAAPAAIPDEIRQQAEAIAARMSLRDKACLVVGARSALAGEIVGTQAHSVPGAAGETVTFTEYGIPGMVLADGPAGLRLNPRYGINPETGKIYEPKDRFEMLEIRFFGKEFLHEGEEVRFQFATAIPIGTLLAQSYDTGLVERVGEAIAEEMKAFGVTVWLAPGMNIHRNPLCGRNFEYYSEDPVLSGKMAAAITRGVQKTPGIGVSIKHFAANNQEENRMHVNELISERALREIYLKGFEIAVKTSNPLTIMTSYNRINGVHSANNYDLCTTAARKEWGFQGFIMTDWSTTNGGGSSAAKCIMAGNDLVMPGTNSDIQEILDALEGKRLPHLTEEKLNESVIRLIRVALNHERMTAAE